MDSEIFPSIILIARPAAGKSEIIHYLNSLQNIDRKKQYHIGKLFTIDDFPMLWAWFEEDEILENMGYPRLHSTRDGYFLSDYQWNVLISRINLEFQKTARLENRNDYSVIIEFSRGKQHGGYTSAFDHISEDILKETVIFYVSVPWEESLRKNKKRFNPSKPDSILEHSLSDEKLAFLYRDDDWKEIAREEHGFINIKDIPVPFAVFDNDDDVTTLPNAGLSARLKTKFDILWDLFLAR